MLRSLARDRLPQFRQRLSLGATGLSVSPFCIGMVLDPRVIVDAFDRGVNFFFLTSDMHWPLYEASRTGLAHLFRARPGSRDEVVVAATSYVAQAEFAVQPFLEVIDAVPGLARIDLAVIGGVGAPDPARFERFARIRAEGRIPGVRALGSTFHDRATAAAVIASDTLDVAYIRYNTAHRGAERELFPSLRRDRRTLLFHFRAVHGYVPRPAGDDAHATVWRPQVSDHYRFTLSRPELDGILCAPRTLPELDALAGALEQGPLTPDETRVITRLTASHFATKAAASAPPRALGSEARGG